MPPAQQAPSPTPPRALVLGASGGIGAEISRQMLHSGWQVRALYRASPPSLPGMEGMHGYRGDAMHPADVLAAAQTCDVIVHAVNPPAYRGWDRQVLPMIDHTIAAARRVGATIVLPGTVYNFGPDAFPVLAETSPQRPLTPLGRIRVALEERLQRAAQDQGVASIIVRSGDFFGAGARNNWFSQVLVKPGRPLRTITAPGRPGVGHGWAYLPDVAATMLALLQRRVDLPRFSRFHMAGHWDPDGLRMPHTIRDIAMQHGLLPGIRAFPWPWLRLASPFSETLRQLQRMRYLWRQPLQLDNHLLRQTLGEEPHTPWPRAVEATLRSLNCLPPATTRNTD